MPKLNYEGSKELCDYIIEVGKKWVSPPYNVDGWRLDVAADLGHSQEFNHEFGRNFVRQLRKPIRKLLFWQSIMEMLIHGFRATSGILL